MEGNADLKILSVGWLGLDASDKKKQPQNWSTQQADFNSCTLPSIRQEMTEMKSTHLYLQCTQIVDSSICSGSFLKVPVPKGKVP
jgi:hypothetical protein